MKRIILCADDYGQNKTISQAIIELLSKRRLTAVSCIVTTNEWPIQASFLNSYKNQADIGLHFNLTFPGPYSLAQIMFYSCTRMLAKKIVYQALNTQLDEFDKSMGQPPDFIDGHQHIHQFPVIRDVLFDVYEKRDLKSYIRSTYASNIFKKITTSHYFKKMFIQYGLAKTFKKELLEKNIPHPTSFSGIYDFCDKEYRTLFRDFLTQIDDMGLIMCHPGYTNFSDASDEIAIARAREMQYLESDAFLEDCKSQNIALIRFSNNRK